VLSVCVDFVWLLGYQTYIFGSGASGRAAENHRGPERAVDVEDGWEDTTDDREDVNEVEEDGGEDNEIAVGSMDIVLVP
jgi:hypothetical protein